MKNTNYVIIADSAADLEKDQRKLYKVEEPFLGRITFPDGRSIVSSPDWENELKYEEYYGLMSSKKMIFKTSLPNPFEIASRVEEYFKQGKDVLAIIISSGLSGTYSAVMKAGEELMQKYPGRKILTCDTLRYSSAIGMLEIYASRMRDEGKDIEEVFAWLEKTKLCVHEIGIMDDLFFLFRSGRISHMKAIMGSFINLKPMADFNNGNGLSEVIGKAKGYNKSYKAIGEYMKETIVNPHEQTILITDSVRPEQARRIKEVVEKEIQPKEIIFTRVGQTNGANIGPGLVACFYIGKEISKDCLEEKKLLAEILAK